MRVLLLLVAGLMAVTSLRADEIVREAKCRFKGVELYSWLEPMTNTWRYALLSGTNRQKLPAQITASEKAVNGVALLKVQLAQLAIGENVIWSNVDRAH